ncbi:MAG: DUF5682 family protein, partial [Myxococcota bacterium]|nr:DUF5682 family protein [Myxococcota bacterium]
MLFEEWKPQVHILGVRHHGPRSARHVKNELDRIRPRVVLIEGPSDANAQLAYWDLLEPPVALLAYERDDPSKALFYPFALFSPEWQALLWAKQNDTPVFFIDIPAKFSMARSAEKDVPRKDPFRLLNQLSGMGEDDIWWDRFLEEHSGEESIFPLIGELIGHLRSEVPTSSWDSIREAYMRLEIAKAKRKYKEPLAVVCGAWHVPALQDSIPAKSDRLQIKGLESVKLSFSWVPWSYERLCLSSGYGAGLTAPDWYRFLWECGGRVDPSIWFSQKAGVFREAGLSASTAELIDAVHMSHQLAALREHAVISLRDVKDSTIAVLMSGNRKTWSVLRHKILVTSNLGVVDPTLPKTPLEKEFLKKVKSLRLKLDTDVREIRLDLRTDSGRAKSIFFHRLSILGLPWAVKEEEQGGRGTFWEHWSYRWKPDYVLHLIESLRWGTTLVSAARGAVENGFEHEKEIVSILDLLTEAIGADLPQSIVFGCRSLGDVIVQCSEPSDFLDAVPRLIFMLVYGRAGGLPREAVRAMIDRMVESLSFSLPNSCLGQASEKAMEKIEQIRNVLHALQLLDDERLLNLWIDTLRDLSDKGRILPILRGYALRVLHDLNMVDDDALFVRLQKELSLVEEAMVIGQWIEGFLLGSAQILLYDTRFFDIVERWLLSLREDDFQLLLPLLRRVFSSFRAPEQAALR